MRRRPLNVHYSQHKLRGLHVKLHFVSLVAAFIYNLHVIKMFGDRVGEMVT